MVYNYNVKVDRIVDGDTLDLRIDQGFKNWHHARVRLAGIDTPESRTKDLREKKYGKMSTKWLKNRLKNQKVIICKVLDRGKFGRPLVTLHIDGNNINDEMIAQRMAVAYHGQSKDDIRAAHEANWDWFEKQNK